MNQEIISSKRIGEHYIKVNHHSGLTILLYPMEGFSTAYAMFSTKYGSVDNCFRASKDEAFAEVPAGIAHYLEHKLFESEDGDAFSRYAKTGASANAFTSFDKTAYLFACSDNFKETIEILLDFVTHPYFTKETVEKEQGIIGQEIRMCDDDPDWKVMFNLMECLYENHPVKTDIAGTVESISEISAELLYKCYNTFYNLHNMVLTVAGNFLPQDVLDVADKILKPAPDFQVERQDVSEPKSIVSQRIDQKLPVATPLFEIGFKSPNYGNSDNFKNMILDEMIVDMIAGETTPLYQKLYNSGLINNGMSGETMNGRDYLCTLFSGESSNPDMVYKKLCEEIVSAQKEGLKQDTFDRIKKSTYGRYLHMFCRPEFIASVMTNTYFAEMTVYELLEFVANVTKDQLEIRLHEDFNVECSALSIVHS